MAKRKQRSKYFYHYQRAWALVFAIGSLGGLLLFGLVLVSGFIDWYNFGGVPSELSANELFEKGPGQQRFVRLTGVQLGTETWEQTQGSSTVSYVTAASSEGPPLLPGRGGKPPRLFLIRVSSKISDDLYDRINETGEVTGKLVAKSYRPEAPHRQYLARAYPGSDTTQMWVLELQSVPTLFPVYVGGGLALISFIVGVVALLWFRWAQRAERVKPPPLPRL